MARSQISLYLLPLQGNVSDTETRDQQGGF